MVVLGLWTTHSCRETFDARHTQKVVWPSKIECREQPVDDSAKCRQVETMRASKIGGFLASK